MTNIQPRLWNRNGKYYVRVAVPRKLFSLVKKTEIRYSLHSNNYQEALLKCRVESYKIDRWLEKIKMEESKKGELLLGESDIDAIRLERIGQIEKERQNWLHQYKIEPEKSFGLFTNDNFNKWVKNDPDYPERLMNCQPSLVNYNPEEPEEVEYQEGLSVDSLEFQKAMILDWFNQYMKKQLKENKSLPKRVKNIIKRYVDGKITFSARGLIIDGKKDLSGVFSALIPLEKYANEKAIASFHHQPFDVDGKLKILLSAWEQQQEKLLMASQLGQEIQQKHHWEQVFDLEKKQKEKKLGRPLRAKSIKTARSRLNTIFQFLKKEYVEDITEDDCEILSFKTDKFFSNHKKTQYISIRTQGKYLSEFIMLMECARKKYHLPLCARDYVITPSQEQIFTQATIRTTYTEKDLIKLFIDDEKFSQYRYHGEYFPRFWIPLIALYSGFRENEICQLEVSNIKEIDGIPCFIITDTGYLQSLKNRFSKRNVPIHSKLIELGFLDFVEKVKSSAPIIQEYCKKDAKIPRSNQGNIYYNIHNPKGLFYTLTYTDGNNWTRKISSWFNTLLERKKMDIQPSKEDESKFEALVFHCTRHTLTSIASNTTNIREGEIDSLLGWSTKSMRGHYTHIDMKKMRELINQIKYPEFEKYFDKLMPDPINEAKPLKPVVKKSGYYEYLQQRKKTSSI